MAERLILENMAYDPEEQAHYAYRDEREGRLALSKRTVLRSNPVCENGFDLNVIVHTEGFTTLASLQMKGDIDLQGGDTYWVIYGKGLERAKGLKVSPVAAVVVKGEIAFELPEFDTQGHLAKMGLTVEELI